MLANKPLVSIGMPVYNGDRFIRQALDSLLSQDYENFELSISDNASTDGTAQICREYAAKDKRIRFYRNETNLGSFANFKRVFELSWGEYFVWAADHDLWHTNFISRCVSILECDPDVVLAYGRTMWIDNGGNALGLTEDRIDTRGMPAVERYKYLIRNLTLCNMVHGVIRRRALSGQGMFFNVWGPDHALLAALALRGGFAQIDEPLYYRRQNRPLEEQWKKERLLHDLDPTTAAERSKKSIEDLWRELGNADLKVVAFAPISLLEKRDAAIATVQCFRDRFGVQGGLITPTNGPPHEARLNMNDAELLAFYSERYKDADVDQFLLTSRKERLQGLCNLVRTGEFYLDVGCANGTHMEVLNQRGIKGIGLDLSVPNILRGRQKYPNLKFIHGFAEDIPFKDDYFDIVLLGDVIEHLRNPILGLAECLRVSRCGVALCVPVDEQCTEEHISPFSLKSIVKLCQFFELDVSLFDFEGKKIRENEREDISKLPTLPWVLIRAEKTSQTDGAVQRVLSVEGKKEDEKLKEEILKNDEWAKHIDGLRPETDTARFNLLSHLIEGQKVLEIGCGNGDLSIEVAKKGFNIVGVDINQAGIHQGMLRAKNGNLDSKASFFVMDATSLRFPDNSFDSVLIAGVLEHMRNSRKFLEEAVRVVRNGGRIIVSVPEGLLVPFEGHLRVFFEDTLKTELSQYTSELEWHKLPLDKWLICSFFAKKSELDVKEGPVVDIIMPTYNGRKYIKNAIKSVINQTYRNWNLVVVNDGGEDTGDVLDEFHDGRIKYITTEHKGKAHAVNVGINNSSGEFIGYLDDDDILYPIHLEVLTEVALNKKQDFVYVDWYEVFHDENNKEFTREFAFRPEVDLSMLILQNYINHKCILHRRLLLEETGMYDEELEILIDWDMIRRLASIRKPHHIPSATSERIRYYKGGIISNRITGLWWSDIHRARRSAVKIINKTMNLQATTQELKEALVKAMLPFGYQYNQEMPGIIRTKEAEVSSLQSSLQQKEAEVSSLQSSLYRFETATSITRSGLSSLKAQLDSITFSLPWRAAKRLEYMANKLLPFGTRRRLFVKLIVKVIVHPKQFIKSLTPRNVSRFLLHLITKGPTKVGQMVDRKLGPPR